MRRPPRRFAIEILFKLAVLAVNCIVPVKPHSSARSPSVQQTAFPNYLGPSNRPLPLPLLSAPIPYHYGLFQPRTNGNLSSEDTVPYSISINEGDSIDVKIQTKSSITINLNRQVSSDVKVKVSVYSGPSLVSFEGQNNSIANSTNATSFIIVTFPANNFGDREIPFHTNDAAGHAEIVCQVIQKPPNITIEDSSAYISLNIHKGWVLLILINIVGWTYFAAWSFSFYFQVALNYQRKSVIGLNFDFIVLNLLGFICYSIYNMALLFSRETRQDYYNRYAYSRIPVEYNDLFFALHAFVITFITVLQCLVYERGQQRVSILAAIFIGTTSVAAIGLYIAYLFKNVALLDVVLYLSYVKLAISIIKYSPQAYMNYIRKATTGWSIHNILLDFTGGMLSITQMLLLAYCYDDWLSIFGNPTKFGLGLVSILFDVLFLVQHYVLYSQTDALEASSESIPEPVINQSIRSVGYCPQPIHNQAGSDRDENEDVNA